MAKKAAATAAQILNERTAAAAEQIILDAGKDREAEPGAARPVGRPKKNFDYCRLSLYIPRETRRQLEIIAFEESAPGDLKTVTDMIIKLAAEETARRERAAKRSEKN